MVARLALVAQVIGWFSVAVGVVVLAVGWWLGHPSVASLIPGQVTMKANTAVGIGLSGVVVIAVARRWSPWWTLVTAVAVLVIGAVTSCEYLLHALWSGFDELLAAESGAAAMTAFPGRMGLNTAFDFVLLGIAGVLLATRRAPNLRQGLALVVIIVGTVAEMGYLLQVPAMSGHVFGILTQMAVPTATAHLLLGVAFLIVTTDRGWAKLFASPLAGGRVARTWMPLLLVVMILIASLAQFVEQHSAEAHWGHQFGLVVSVVAVAAATLLLARRTDRLDQDRLREAAVAVDRSARLYELAFEGSPVGMVVGDQSGRVTDVNPAFSALVGKSPLAITDGESVWTLSDPEYVASNAAVLDELLSGTRKDASVDTVLVAADGRSVPVKVDAVRVDLDDEHRVFGFITDLTEIREAQRDLELKNEELAYLAERDPLTGVLNRRGFLDHVQEALNIHPDRPSAVLFIDIDGFKMVNDVYGHRLGDRFLCAIAEKLVQTSNADGGQVGRVGGDEFAVLLAECEPAGVANVASRLGRSVRDPVIVEGVTLTASCSIGYAVSDAWLRDCEEFLARADQDMYATRRARRAGLEQRVEELRDAIGTGQLTTHFQPIWALNPGGPTLSGYEALVRWRHPERGLVPPFEFISTAEEGGLIHSLDMWVARDALQRMSAKPGLSLAINCSALTLVNVGVAGEIAGAIAAVNRDPRSVVVELTESVDIPDNSQIRLL